MNLNLNLNLNDKVIDQLQQKPTLFSSFYSILDLNFLSNSNDKNSIKKAFRYVIIIYYCCIVVVVLL